ncbi:MAG: dinitrogenase iron-molybdenum cofactor biosynthesis protein [Methanosarcinales archaeon]|nr:dinitrogenase iron-molybdenum cofactor biosynthesis protein [Methanosarcinales archaeon]
MKVCIPTEREGGIDDAVGQHFGRVPTYTLVDVETNKVEVIPNTSEHRGGVGVPPEFISKTGTHVMLCSGLGPKAVHMFEEFGIDVFVGAEGTVRDAIEAWQQGRLTEATDENACKEHRDH